LVLGAAGGGVDEKGSLEGRLGVNAEGGGFREAEEAEDTEVWVGEDDAGVVRGAGAMPLA
jgi:hypothetical protein